MLTHSSARDTRSISSPSRPRATATAAAGASGISVTHQRAPCSAAGSGVWDVLRGCCGHHRSFIVEDLDGRHTRAQHASRPRDAEAATGTPSRKGPAGSPPVARSMDPPPLSSDELVRRMTSPPSGAGPSGWARRTQTEESEKEPEPMTSSSVPPRLPVSAWRVTSAHSASSTGRTPSAAAPRVGMSRLSLRLNLR